MTFTEIVQEIKDRLNLTSAEATTRVGREVNARYRRVTSAIGLDVSRRVLDVSGLGAMGQSTFTFTGLAKIERVFDTRGGKIALLNEITFDEMRGTALRSDDAATLYAIQSIHPNAITVMVNAVIKTIWDLKADGLQTAATLSGAMAPGFSEDYHDILVEGVVADELRKMEKLTDAKTAEQLFEYRLSELRIFIAKSAYLTRRQGGRANGKSGAGGSRAAEGGGGGVPGDQDIHQTGLVTFDRDPNAPFAVSPGSAPVANLIAEGAIYVTNVETDHLIGRDSPGTGNSEHLAIGGGLEMTGTLSLQRSALTGAITAPAGSNVTTLSTNIIGAGQIIDGSVGTAELADGSVTNPKLADNAVTLTKIADGSITSAKIVDATITSFDLAPNSVTSSKIVDNAVIASKIADGNVTTAKLADNSVSTSKILDLNVTTAKLADGAVTAPKLAAGSLTLDKFPAMAASRLLGRGDSGTGTPQEITLGANLSMSGTTLIATVTGGGSGAPAGAINSIQYNNAGALGGTNLFYSAGLLEQRDAALAVGTTPAQSGALRLAHGTGNEIKFRNTNNTADLRFAAVSGTALYFGGDTSTTVMLDPFVQFNASTVFGASSLAIGTNPASQGALRLANNVAVFARNATNTNDIRVAQVDTANNVVVGYLQASPLYLDAATSLNLRINGATSSLVFESGILHPSTDAVLDLGDGTRRFRQGFFSHTLTAATISATTVNAGSLGSTPINPANLTGTVPDAKLSANVALKNIDNAFTSYQTLPDSTTIQGANSILFYRSTASPVDAKLWRTINYADGALRFEAINDAQTVVQGPIQFNRDGSILATGLGATPLNAASLTGTVADARLSTNVFLKNAPQTITSALTVRSSGAGDIAARIKFLDDVSSAVGSKRWQMYNYQGNVAIAAMDDADAIVQASFGFARTGTFFTTAVHLDGSDDTDPMTLDSYREGVWTPTLDSTNGASGVTYALNIGSYIKIGQLVWICFDVALTSAGTMTGELLILGLPFRAKTPTHPSAPSLLVANIGIESHGVAGRINADAWNIQLLVQGMTTGYFQPLVPAWITATSRFQGSLIYRANA